MQRKGGLVHQSDVPLFLCLYALVLFQVSCKNMRGEPKSAGNGMGVSVSFENGGASKSHFARLRFRVLFSSLTASSPEVLATEWGCQSV